ncbi:hypothetical protein ACFFX0_01210 [Citricoccus parietis]|uniref:Uncharacterized protein n=1 Tax=Citricoccus parietis TaxID=592307 RepID=A0ABV5FT70_9MICC
MLPTRRPGVRSAGIPRAPRRLRAGRRAGRSPLPRPTPSVRRSAARSRGPGRAPGARGPRPRGAPSPDRVPPAGRWPWPGARRPSARHRRRPSWPVPRPRRPPVLRPARAGAGVGRRPPARRVAGRRVPAVPAVLPVRQRAAVRPTARGASPARPGRRRPSRPGRTGPGPGQP